MCICGRAVTVRRETRNLLGSPRAGSNPAECGNFCNFLLFATFYFLFTQLSLISSRQPWSPHLDQLSWFLGAKSGRISSVTSSMIDFSEFSTSLRNPRWRQDSGVLRFFGPERRGLKRRGFICFCKRERTLVCKRIRRGFSWHRHRSTSARCDHATALRLLV